MWVRSAKLSSTPFTVTMACRPLYTARAMSSKVSVAMATSGRRRISVSTGSSAGTVLPCTGTTFSCGSKLVKKLATRSWKPLNTLSTMTSAMVATATPMTEISEMMLMAWVFFLEKR